MAVSCFECVQNRLNRAHLRAPSAPNKRLIKQPRRSTGLCPWLGGSPLLFFFPPTRFFWLLWSAEVGEATAVYFRPVRSWPQLLPAVERALGAARRFARRRVTRRRRPVAVVARWQRVAAASIQPRTKTKRTQPDWPRSDPDDPAAVSLPVSTRSDRSRHALGASPPPHRAGPVIGRHRYGPRWPRGRGEQRPLHSPAGVVAAKVASACARISIRRLIVSRWRVFAAGQRAQQCLADAATIRTHFRVPWGETAVPLAAPTLHCISRTVPFVESLTTRAVSLASPVP